MARNVAQSSKVASPQIRRNTIIKCCKKCLIEEEEKCATKSTISEDIMGKTCGNALEEEADVLDVRLPGSNSLEEEPNTHIN